MLIENIALAGESPDAVSQTSNSLEPVSILEQSDRYSQNNHHLKQANPVIHLGDDLYQSKALAQVTSVSQLSDVQPTDWAFQALQSLVERYGCIAGYPDSTFRGNRALTRYEFAAGLNACLERVNELIATASGENVTKENLTTLGRLQEEFATEFGGSQGTRQGQDPSLGKPIGFGETGETRFTPSSVTQEGDVAITQIQYRFPVGERLKVYLEAGTTDPTYISDTISPFVDTATGALSNFGQVNPVYFPIGNQAGAAANYLITPALSLDFGYLGEIDDANNPGEDAGIFNGGHSAMVQLVYNSDRFHCCLTLPQLLLK